MIEYTIKRIFAAIPVLFGILLLTFLLLNVIPGDPARAVAGPRADEQTLARIRSEMELDKPLMTRFFSYSGKILKGDFGNSIVTGRPIMTSFKEKFPVTLKLAVMAALISAILGVAMGIISAVNKGGFIDKLSTVMTVTGISVPIFLAAIVISYVFTVKIPIFASADTTDFSGLLPFILPAATLGMRSAAFLARIVRSGMIEVLNNDYIRTAKAKGLRKSRILFSHALTNALIPIITVIALDFSSYLNGSVIVETIFTLPGIGSFAMNAISQRDYPVIQATILCGAFIFIFINLLTDLIYAWLNPQIRDEMSGKVSK